MKRVTATPYHQPVCMCEWCRPCMLWTWRTTRRTLRWTSSSDPSSAAVSSMLTHCHLLQTTSIHLWVWNYLSLWHMCLCQQAVWSGMGLSTGKVTAVYGGSGLSVVYVSELCLHLLLARSLGNGDEHCSHWSQSCEGALLTINDLT